MIGVLPDNVWWRVLDYLWDMRDDKRCIARMTQVSKGILQLVQMKLAKKTLDVRQSLIRIYGEPGCRTRVQPVEPQLVWGEDPFEANIVEKIMIRDYGSFHLLDAIVRNRFIENQSGARMLLGASQTGQRFAMLNYFPEHPGRYWVTRIGGFNRMEDQLNQVLYLSMKYKGLEENGVLMNLDEALDKLLEEYNTETQGRGDL